MTWELAGWVLAVWLFGALLVALFVRGASYARKRVEELEQENRQIAFRARCLECLLIVRSCRGDLETLNRAADNGMGC